MKSTWLILGFMLLELAAIAVIAEDQSTLSSEWQDFKKKFGKQYSPEEDEWRYELFLVSKAEIERFNREESKEAGYSKEVNEFSDLTPDEMEGYLGYRDHSDLVVLRSLSEEAKQFLEDLLRDDDDLPESFDWRQHEGRVSSVKHQELCGSCWAMALAGLLEGQEMKVTNLTTLVDLSVQNIMDCTYPASYVSCKEGGKPFRGIEALARIGGVMSEEDYPYKAVDGQECKFDISRSVISPREAIFLPGNDELALKKVVKRYGPVLVAFEAILSELSEIGDGVYKGGPECGAKLNHAVLVIGYGTDPIRGDYWIIKNSWGAGWNDKGYFKMAMGYNNCGILKWPMIAMF